MGLQYVTSAWFLASICQDILKFQFFLTSLVFLQKILLSNYLTIYLKVDVLHIGRAAASARFSERTCRC